MKKFLNKAKDSYKEFQDNQHQSGDGGASQQPMAQQPNQPVDLGPPASIDVLRYRYHHGTNLGSIFGISSISFSSSFYLISSHLMILILIPLLPYIKLTIPVLEKWLHGSMFPASSKGGSELDAATASLSELGLDATRSKFEQHWANAVSDSDFTWLVNEAKCTSIRLPIGYFTLGPEYCKGTPFEKVSGVYANAWAAVRALVARARSHGIGVLIDLHALPGGANGDAHSGSGTGKAEFWGSRGNVALVRKVLGAIAGEVRGGMDGVVGIQVVNEAVWGAKHMYEFYEQALETIGGVDARIPVYISDAWDLDKALKWCNGRKRGGCPVVVDTHKYYTFSEKDRAQAPQEIIARIGGELKQLDGKIGSLCERGEAQVVIGEWSCVLDGKTWSRVSPQEKNNLVTQFGRAQSAVWQQRAGGSYFWTYKMDWMDGGEWGFAEQTKKGNIPPPAYLCLPAHEVRNRLQTASERRKELGDGAKRGHEGYWDGQSPGQRFEHWRYGEGWELGYSDAMKFFCV
ncbi:Glucan 1,3-beta-glucosidase [Lachnellula subtilissima]|uniref:Glucan 1,3-beta-glucosidase n=1 Tax=Lachnellula subtilissima TaxID=602034 RepID=A0A8H8UFB8_9HELO|nr:Glucan 1,3-beta-glucosidase [Lachnellula subtilissima]